MPNPVGETVRSAASGSVIWAADGLRVLGGAFQNSPSYGNVVLIEHDFGYHNHPIYTLYAHLSATLVQQGDLVQAGDVIGLVGETGRVSGPHVHFEVRLNENHYRSTFNPVLWMVPYVGHGVIAGRVTDTNGNMLQDIGVTVNNWATGLVQDTTSTYVFLDNDLDVNPDPVWDENFAVGDVPVGRYEVVVTVNGQRLSKVIDVQEGTTSFVELEPQEPATAQPIATETP
jgi:murein DD-endopeptidase MepM/ murein hydrolase activator NlpD